MILADMADNSDVWDDRLALQARWTLAQKGWKVAVEWKPTPLGVGLFAAQTVPAGTLLRTGVWGQNLLPFGSLDDVHAFLGPESDDAYQARLRYFKDYLWGFYPSHCTDAQGYYQGAKPENNTDDPRLFAMWLPGNGLNHAAVPNTVYTSAENGINLVALTDLTAGEELYDDYRRHGAPPPAWLQGFAARHGVTLNFANCNDFVV